MDKRIHMNNGADRASYDAAGAYPGAPFDAAYGSEDGLAPDDFGPYAYDPEGYGADEYASDGLAPDDFGPYAYDPVEDGTAVMSAVPAQGRGFAEGGTSVMPVGMVPAGQGPASRAAAGAATFGMGVAGKGAGKGSGPKGFGGSKGEDGGGSRKGLGKKIALGILAVLLAVLIGGGIWFWQYVQNVSNKIHAGVDENLQAALSEEAKPGEPFYMLLMGVDRSAERAGTAEYGNDFRSDSMILARIDPEQKAVTLISIQRDTYVNIEGYGYNKINAAHAFGGPALTVETVSKFAGVPISHYAEIDFDGFKAAVDSLGGIDVTVPVEINDPDAGGYVPAGPQTLNGEQALILCRSRHTYDSVGPGDFYRAANQRMVIGAIVKKILASDPVTMANTVTSMADYITTDMSLEQILAVANSMRGTDADKNIYSAMNPTVSSYDGNIWIEYCDLQPWRTMMMRVDKGLPPYEDEERNKNDGGTLDGTVWSGEASSAA